MLGLFGPKTADTPIPAALSSSAQISIGDALSLGSPHIPIHANMAPKMMVKPLHGASSESGVSARAREVSTPSQKRFMMQAMKNLRLWHKGRCASTVVDLRTNSRAPQLPKAESTELEKPIHTSTGSPSDEVLVAFIVAFI